MALEPGVVFTVEPGIYVAPDSENVDERFLILITDGGVECLTQYPRKLFVKD